MADATPATNATNHTRYFNLPLFISTDRPSWLVDWNGAMGEIDTILNDIATTSEGASSAVSTIQTQIDTLSATVTSLNGIVETAVADVASMQTTVDAVDTRLDSVESDLITQNNLIKTLSDTVVAMQATVSTLDNHVDTLNDAVTAMGVNVSAIQTALNGVTSDIATINSTLTSLDTRVTALENAGSGASGSGYRNDASFITSSATVNGRTAVFALNTLGENDSAQVTLYYGSGGTIKLAYLPFGSSDALTDSNCFLVDSSGNAGSITVSFTGPGQIFADGSGVVTIRYDISQA